MKAVQLPAPESPVRALWHRVTVLLALAVLGGTLAALAGLLVASWVTGSTDAWRRPSVVPLSLWCLAAALLAVWLGRIASRFGRWDRRAAAAEIESRVQLPSGAVRGAIESGLDRPGVSRSLIAFHRAWVAERLAGRRVSELGSGLTRSARTYAIGGISLALAGTLTSATLWLTARDSSRAAWAAVLHPIRHLSAPPLPPLGLSADVDGVRRGRDLPVTVYAPARDSVQLVWQPVGEVAARRWYRVVDGITSATVPRVDAPTSVWATAPDGAVSDTLRVRPIDPLLLLNLQATLRYPPHTGRESEVMSAPLPPIVVPEGTRASLSGVTTRALDSVALREPSGGVIPFELTDDRRFRASFTLRSGVWGWDMVGLEGEELEGDPDSLYVTIVPDSAPLVRIVYPGVDTVLSTDMIQPLLIEASDDYGLTTIEMVSWRVSLWGETWPELVEPLPLESTRSLASLTALLDVRGRGFLPGDTVHYFVRAFDNAPDPNVGMSREFVLRLPTLDEVRERTVSEAHDLVESTDRLAQRAREQEESTQALERSTERQPAPGISRPTESEAGVEFRDTEAARQALDEANKLLEEAREIQESLRELQESIQNAGLNDTSVLERLREIESLYERILTPELEEKIRQLREALVELDPDKIREAIRDLAEGSVDFRERIEQSLELLRRAALETEFETLETRAEELSEAHDDLSEAVAETEPSPVDSAGRRLESQARELAERTDALSQELERFAGELGQAGEEQAAEQAEQARSLSGEAARADQQTAGAVSANRRQAAQSASRAASQMQAAASALEEGREGMQQRWRQEVTEALSRAQAEAMELARRQRELNESLDSSDPRERAEARSEEVAIKRGVDQIGQQLAEAARASLLLDQSVIKQAGEAGATLEQLLGQLGDGTRAERGDPRLGEQASESLNELAYRLIQAQDAAAQARSGTGLQDALQQLAQLAEQQGELNAEAGGITPGAISDIVLEELRQLASRQRAISEQLRQLDRSVGPRGQVLGQLDALAREAEELSREMQRGRWDAEVIERQNQLFQRLLDAGRTLERDEFERERRAERPGDVEILRPGELSPELLRGTPFPLPAEEVLRRYPPAYRRLILEYFDRLNGREDGGGS